MEECVEHCHSPGLPGRTRGAGPRVLCLWRARRQRRRSRDRRDEGGSRSRALLGSLGRLLARLSVIESGLRMPQGRVGCNRCNRRIGHW